MKQTGYTKVPDVVFTWLPYLSEAELKTLLIIIRQTIGWQKARDKLSFSQYKQKTGLSGRSITSAIESLSIRNFIEITDHLGTILKTNERRYRKDIYYAPTDFTNAKSSLSNEKLDKTSMQNLPLTIYNTYTQQQTRISSSKIKKQSDKERIECIEKRRQNLSCSCLRCAKG